MSRYLIDDYFLKDGTFVPPNANLIFTLDGHRVFIVQAADDDEGWIEAPLINCETGEPHFDHFAEDYVIIRKSGQVEILVDDRNYSTEKEPLWVAAARDPSYPFRFDPATGDVG
jgi:hypothetical protein